MKSAERRDGVGVPGEYRRKQTNISDRGENATQQDARKSLGEGWNGEERGTRLIPRVSCVLGHTIVPGYPRQTSPINILVIG